MSVTIIANDDSAAQANRTELDMASGKLSMPTGRVAVDKSPVLQYGNSGLSMIGNETVLANIVPSGDWVAGRALSIRPGPGGDACLSFYETNRPEVMPPRQTGWLFNPNGSDGLGFYPAPVQRFGPGEVVPDSSLSFMRAYHGIPFVGVQALHLGDDHGFKVGDVVFATDGPYINEVIPEWRRITSLGPKDAVFLDQPLMKQYQHGTLVGGPFPRRMSFQGLGFSGTWGPVLLQQCWDAKFNFCRFDPAQGWVSAIGCGNLRFTNCDMPSGFQSSASHDIRFRGGCVKEVVGEQCATDLRFELVRFGPGSVDSKVGCRSWQIKDCVTTGDLFVYDDWLVDNHIAYGKVVVRGKNAVVRDLWSEQQVEVQAAYQGQPEGSGTHVTLDRITAPSIYCGPGTSGIIRSRTCPVHGDTSKWQITPR